MENKSRMVWRITIILLGTLLLLPAYYWAHNPGGSTVAALALGKTLGLALANLLIVAILFTISGGIGRAALFRLDLSTLSRSERIAVATAPGLGVVSGGATLIGMAGLFNLAGLWLPLIVCAVLLRKFVLAWLVDWRDMFRNLEIQSVWARYLSVLVLILLALALLRALSPPFAWDSLTYHLVAPQRYLAAGRIAAHADNHFLGFPQLAEVLYGVAMSPLRSGEAGVLVHYGFGLIGLLGIFGLTRRFVGGESAWLALMLPLSGLSLWLLFGWAYVDLAVLAYGAVGLVAATQWRETDHIGWLILLGLFAGFAFSVKYTAVALGIALTVFIIVTHPRQFLRNGAIFAVAALIAFAPWLIKGLLLYSNPVYPFAFGGLNWDAERSATFSTFGSGLLTTSDAWQLPILPIAATIFGVEKGGGFAFTAGSWLLIAPLLLVPGWRFLSDRAQKLARDCVTIALPMLLFWFILAGASEIGVQTRLIALAFPVAVVMGALGFHALWQFPEKPVQISFIVRAALVVTLAFSVIEAVRQLTDERALPYLTALETRDSFLDHNLGAYANAMRELENLPQGSTVLLLWEPRSFYCPPNVACQPDILFDHWARPLRNGATADKVFAAWQEDGIDYLLFWESGFEQELNNPNSRFLAENEGFTAARDESLTQTWTDGVRYSLYGWGE